VKYVAQNHSSSMIQPSGCRCDWRIYCTRRLKQLATEWGGIPRSVKPSGSSFLCTPDQPLQGRRGKEANDPAALINKPKGSRENNGWLPSITVTTNHLALPYFYRGNQRIQGKKLLVRNRKRMAGVSRDWARGRWTLTRRSEPKRFEQSFKTICCGVRASSRNQKSPASRRGVIWEVYQGTSSIKDRSR
jgi:hypothetical protein